MRAAGRLGINPLKAVTLIGVAALSDPGLLIEIEAVAILDRAEGTRPVSGWVGRAIP